MTNEHFHYRVRTGRFAMVTAQAVTAVIGRGYSGAIAYRDNPEGEAIRGQGPIPVGLWHVSRPIRHPKLGPLSFPLAALDPETGGIIPAPHGRSGFYIHGDSIRAPGTASSGCIVLNRMARERLARFRLAGCTRLVVVA